MLRFVFHYLVSEKPVTPWFSWVPGNGAEVGSRAPRFPCGRTDVASQNGSHRPRWPPSPSGGLQRGREVAHQGSGRALCRVCSRHMPRGTIPQVLEQVWGCFPLGQVKKHSEQPETQRFRVYVSSSPGCIPRLLWESASVLSVRGNFPPLTSVSCWNKAI